NAEGADVPADETARGRRAHGVIDDGELEAEAVSLARIGAERRTVTTDDHVGVTDALDPAALERESVRAGTDTPDRQRAKQTKNLHAKTPTDIRKAVRGNHKNDSHKDTSSLIACQASSYKITPSE